MNFIVIFSVIIAGCIAKPLDDSANAQILRYEVNKNKSRLNAFSNNHFVSPKERQYWN